MLITVTNRVFLSMLPLLVPVGFGSSQQLACGSTFSAHGGGRQAGRSEGTGAAARGTYERSAEKAGCNEEDGML